MLEQDSQKNEWKLAMRIATSPSDRWLIKAADWNPELSTRYRINRAIGRPRKRWDDDINEFLKQVEEETENPTESSDQIKKTWINTAKVRGRWTLLEENHTKRIQKQDMKTIRERKEFFLTDQRIAKDRGSWALLEEAYTMTVEERQEMRKRDNDQSRPARYFDGVRLSDEETANIT